MSDVALAAPILLADRGAEASPSSTRETRGSPYGSLVSCAPARQLREITMTNMLETPLLPPPPPPLPRRRSKTGLVAGGIAVALAAAGTGGFLLGNRSESPSVARKTTVASTGRVSSATGVKPVAASAAPSPVPTSGTVEELLTAALALHVKGQLADATTVYQAILKKDPNHVLAHYNLGQIAQVGGDNAAALAQYEKALATNTDYTPAIYNSAIAYEAVGDATKAIEFYRRALTLDPNSAPAMFRLGSLLVAQGNPEEGQPFVNRALVLDPALASARK